MGKKKREKSLIKTIIMLINKTLTTEAIKHIFSHLKCLNT